jgi:hypothetical protein
MASLLPRFLMPPDLVQASGEDLLDPVRSEVYAPRA